MATENRYEYGMRTKGKYMTAVSTLHTLSFMTMDMSHKARSFQPPHHINTQLEPTSTSSSTCENQLLTIYRNTNMQPYL